MLNMNTQTQKENKNIDLGIATKKELYDALIYYKTLAIGQAAYIEGLEKENCDAINTCLKLARENDTMTEQMFTSPFFYGHEVKM